MATIAVRMTEKVRATADDGYWRKWGIRRQAGKRRKAGKVMRLKSPKMETNPSTADPIRAGDYDCISA